MGTSASRLARLGLAVMACLIVAAFIAPMAFAGSTYFDQYPAVGGVCAEPMPKISVKVSDPAGINTGYQLKIDGVSKTPKVTWGPGSSYCMLSYQVTAPLSNGTHTVYASVYTGAGRTSTTWTFTESNAPQLGPLTPADGSTVNSQKPTISAVANTSGTSLAAYSMKVDGAAVTPAYDSATKTISYTPFARLANDRDHTVEVSVTDSSGASTTVSWHFRVQIYVSMVDTQGCTACHASYPTAHPMTNCWGCHAADAPFSAYWNMDNMQQYAHASDYLVGIDCAYCHSSQFPKVPSHPANLDSAHNTTTDMSGCSCHVSELTIEHNRYLDPETGEPKVTCADCHEPTRPEVAAAMANGSRYCIDCHTIPAGHPYASIDHVADVGEVADLSGKKCGECHEMDLMTEHEKASSSSAGAQCSNCHDTPRDTFASWNQTCSQGGCHATGSATAMHANQSAAHVPSGSAAGCQGSECHTFSDVAALHSSASTTTAGGTYTSCNVCHRPGVVVTKDCATCHPERLEPHGYDPAMHTAADADSLGCGRGAGCHVGTEAKPLHPTCGTCHGTATTPNLTTDKTRFACKDCHTTSGVDYHKTFGSTHTFSALGASCQQSGCHSTSLVSVHSPYVGAGKRYPAYADACALCHQNASSTRIPADATSDCVSCHATLHGDPDVIHLSTVTSGSISILGTSYGTHQCSECHASNDVRTLHGGSSGCSTCHPTPRDSIGAWNGTCATAGCHDAGASKPQHGALDSAHTLPSGVTCTSGGCHGSTNSIAAIHSASSATVGGQTRTSCQICHAAGVTPTSDCTTCHDLNNAHAALEPVHQGSSSSNAYTFTTGGLQSGSHGLSDGTYGPCSQCHSMKLLTVHKNSCSFCHADTARAAAKAAVTAGQTNCEACHFSAHPQVENAYHTAMWDSGDGWCGECHGGSDGCTRCHYGDDTPPVTTSNAVGAYVDDASITLNSTDAHGVAGTYYRLDGGSAVKATGAAIVVDAPANGSAAHTLEFWSIDGSGNQETHKNLSFTIAADTTPPVTTSDARAIYWVNAVIKLTTVDDATSFKTPTTYYQFDNGPVSQGTTAVLPLVALETHTLHYWSVDHAGNVEDRHDATFTFGVGDTTKPVTTSNFNPAAGSVYNASQSVTLSATDAGGSGVESTYYKIDSGTYTKGTSFTVSGDGLHTFSYYSADSAANTETAHVSNQFRIDTVGPVTSSSVPNGSTFYGSQNVTLTATDANGSGVSATKWQLDSTTGAWNTGTSATVPAPASGTVAHTVYFYSIDNAGNAESYKSVAVQSTTAYTSGSVIAATGAPAYVTVPAGVATVQADLYGGQGSPPGVGALGGKGGYLKASIPVTPGQVLTLKVGKAANGTNGGWGGGSGGSGSSPGGGSTSVASGSVVLAEAGGGGGAGISYGGDGGTWNSSTTGGNANGGTGTPCGGGGGWTGGASNRYGGYGGTSGTKTGTNITCTVGGNTTAADGRMSLTFMGLTYTLNYSAGSNGTLTGATAQTVAAGGSGSAVTAVPNTGYHFVDWSDGVTSNPRTDTNVQANKSVTANFAINTYTLAYAAGTGGTLTGSASQTVNYNGSGTAVTAVPNSGYRFVNWSDGVATATRTDTGVTANKSVIANFALNVVDTTPPTGSIVVNANAAYTKTTAVTLTLSATDNTGGSGLSQMRFSNDNSTWSAWESYATSKSWTLTSGNGAKTVYVQYRDVSLNQSSSYSDGITLDGTAPSTTSNIVSGQSYTGAQTFTLSPTDTGGSGVASTKWQLDSTTGSWTTGTSVSVPAPSSGSVSHTLYWYSTDNATNQEATQQVTFTVSAVGTTPPSTTTNAKADYYGTARVDLTGTSAGGGPVAHTYFVLDNGLQAESSTVYVSAPASGTETHRLQYWSVDSAGNVEARKTVEFSVSAAVMSHIRFPGYPVTDTWVQGPEGQVYAAGGTDLVVPAGGPYTVHWEDYDLWVVGEWDPYGCDWTNVYVPAEGITLSPWIFPYGQGFPTPNPDGIAPGTTSNAQSWYSGTATIALTATDAGSGVQATYYTVDGGATQSGTNISVAAPASGTAKHTIQYWSVDKAGLTEPKHSATFTVAAAGTTAGTIAFAPNAPGDLAYWNWTVTTSGGATVATGSSASVIVPTSATAYNVRVDYHNGYYDEPTYETFTALVDSAGKVVTIRFNL